MEHMYTGLPRAYQMRLMDCGLKGEGEWWLVRINMSSPDSQPGRELHSYHSMCLDAGRTI